MFSPYEFVDIVTTEILKVVEKCKIYFKKGKPRGQAFDKRICPGGRDLPNFENLSRDCPGGGGNVWN